MNTLAEKKLKWLEEMRELNNEIARYNPLTAKIQEMFRRGDV